MGAPPRRTIPPEHHYEPWGAAQRLFKERGDEVVISGPAGTGKSRAALEKVHLMCLLNPGMRALVVRKTLASLTATGLVTWREKVVREGLAYNVLTYYGGSSQEPAQYRYANGSVVIMGGMDKAMKVMSSEYDLIFVQEATELTENDWESLTTRLRNGKVSFQQLLADCNPDRPTHWLKQRSDKGQCLMIHAQHTDNPVLYTATGEMTVAGESYMAKLDALTGVRKERLRHGRWAASDGLVYDGFDPAVHLVDSFPVPDEWPRWWSIDFGYTHPFVCQMWAEDPDGRLYLYREVFMTQKTVDQHCETIAKKVMKAAKKEVGRPWIGTWREPRPQAVICDHDAEGRATFEREMGLVTKAANKKVTEGIQAVQQRLRIPDGEKKPRLFLMRDALVERDRNLDDAKAPCCTADEMVGYIWDSSAGEQLKETPRKLEDDGMDALRYVVAERDMGRSYKYRTFAM